MSSETVPFRWLLRRSIALISSGLALFVATGCRTVVHDVPSPVALPGEFPGVAEGDSPLATRWWTALGDPNLDELVQEALSNNFSLSAAWARLDQANAIVRRDSAGLFPQLNATGDRTKTWRRQEIGLDSDDFEHVDVSEYTLGLNASYEIDLWGRVRSARNAALLDADASAEDLRSAALSLSAEVASAWLQIREQRQQLDLLDGQIVTNENVLEAITGRFRRGQADATDVLQQRQLVEARRGEREEVLARLQTFENALAVLLGRPPHTALPVDDAELADPGAFPETGIPSEILNQRPDVRAAYLAVQSADQRVASAIANRYPRLSLTGSWSTSDEDAGELFRSWAATLAGNLAAPVIDGGQRRAEVERNRAVAAERVADYGSALLEAFREVEDALAQEQRQRALVASLARQLDIANEVVAQTRLRYQRGTFDYLRVLDSEQSQQSLERNLLQARRQLIDFRIDLHRALSGGWEVGRQERTTEVAAAGTQANERTEESP